MKGRLYYNGCIHTMEKENEIYYAMVIQNGRVEKLIKEEEALDVYADIERINLNGQTILPGFVDSHVHLTQTGLNAIGVKLDTVTHHKMLLDSVDYASLRLKDEAIIFGTGYDETQMEGKKLPNLKELDQVVSDKPVWLSRVDSHSCLVNSAFLKGLKLPPETPGIDRDADGNPTGILRDRANSLARQKALNMVSNKARKKGILKALEKAVTNGVTMIHALEGGPLFADKDYTFICEFAKGSPVRIEPHFQKMDANVIDDLGLKRLGGCIILDGSFGSRTAALFDPYTDNPSTNGTLYIETELLESFVLEATGKNVQLAFHALGERAIDQIMNAYEKALRVYPNRDLRHRIEHFELPLDRHIEKASELGIILSMQPAFDYYWGGSESMYFERLGAERAKRAIPLHRILKSGAVMIGGSDSDVTPINPIVGIHGAVNHSNAEEQIPVYEAVRMFTYNGAYALKREHELGTLKEGKFADFVILDKDIMALAPECIDQTKAIATYCNGQCIYKRDEE